jgi:hypothetical protein
VVEQQAIDGVQSTRTGGLEGTVGEPQ